MIRVLRFFPRPSRRLPALAQDASPVHDKPLSEAPRAQAVTARNGMVVAQEAMAAQIGVDILKAGGNAVDAAVATGFALAVTYPRAGNIGGGGFMVIWLARPRKAIAIDYREMAPGTIDKDSFPRRCRQCRSAEIARSPGSASACRERWRGLRWRTGNTAPASSRWRNCSRRRSRSRVTASS